jgi:putative transposase
VPRVDDSLQKGHKVTSQDLAFCAPVKLTPPSTLAHLSEPARVYALQRFQVIRPFLENDVPLTEVAKHERIPLRTLWNWIKRYRLGGVAALARQTRIDLKKRRELSPILTEVAEGLALQKPRLSIAVIHRKVFAFAQSKDQVPPSYATVYRIVRKLNPALLTLAHEGAKVYCETFDLIHRQEAEEPNAVWQADHTELDIWVIDDKGQRKKPWLTIILDDYSRAIAGYFLSFNAPSAIQTALALRQAIWRKEISGWHICGIPQVLYTDHGSDFTSKHIEQVAADLKFRLVFSTAGKPRGRGKVERFFQTLSQVFLSRFPGEHGKHVAKLRLDDLARELEMFLVGEYLVTPHSTTKIAPQARWDGEGFIPQMPQSLEQLDLLLLTVAKERCVHQDGIRFSGLRYIDPTLAAYVGEKVILRYDPRDMAEVRVYFEDHFLCRAICQELAGELVPLREIVRARNRQRRELRQTLEERRRTVDSLLEVRRWTAMEPEITAQLPQPAVSSTKLRRYHND